MTTPSLRATIRRHEGVRRKAYKDSRGIWTIGCGHNLQCDPELFPQLRHLIDVGITDTQIDALLDHDIANAEHQLDLYLPWWRHLDNVRQDVMVNMAFNLGIQKLLGFHNTLAAIHDGRYADAAKGMAQSLWDHQVGERADELEAMMATGRLQH